MRLTAAILAILVVILSCLPCADVAALPIAKTEQGSPIQHPLTQHSDDHNDVDLCSPFCHCACYAGFSVLYSPAVIPLRIHIPTAQLHADFSSAEVIEISLPIWQPPQLV